MLLDFTNLILHSHIPTFQCIGRNVFTSIRIAIIIDPYRVCKSISDKLLRNPPMQINWQFNCWAKQKLLLEETLIRDGDTEQ